jgi:cytochrome c oxidase subunit 2
VAAALLLSACGTAGLPDSATEQGDHVTSLWKIFLTLAAIISVLIWVLTTMVVVASIRRRRTEGRDGIPAQHQYRIKLEIAYTIAPLLIVAVLLALTFQATGELTRTSNAPDQLQVKVTGFQWQWQFDYTAERITVSGDPAVLPEMWLPVGRPIRFEVGSPDVIHSFWVPDFLEKRDLIPGVINVMEVNVKAPGQWIGRCAEYCGFNHWQMKFVVCAVSAQEFDAWVRETAARPQPVISGELIDGSSGATTPSAGSRRCPSSPSSDIGFAPTAQGPP